VSVTYSSALTDDVSRVRFWLRDTAVGAGPLPGDANFADSEIEQLVTLEGDWRPAVAAGFEALASAWARHPDFTSGDVSISRSAIAKSYKEQAAEWRRRYGGSGDMATVVIGSMTRIDAYSEAAGDSEYT
jgi:hypothetical protein